MVFTSKVDLSNLISYLYQTPRFEWCVVWCGSKIRCHTNTHLTKITPRAQNMITSLNFAINTTIYNLSMSTRIATSIQLYTTINFATYIRPFNEHENLHFDNKLI